MNKTQTPPVAIFELIPHSAEGAGFVREDTINTPNPIRIIHPKTRVIMNTSVIRVESEKTQGTFVNVPIRHIYGQEAILQKLQEAENMTTSTRDKIVFINGFLTVTRDGANVGLYDFLMANAQNITNEKRVDNGGTITPVFRQVKAEENAGNQNHIEFKQNEAIAYISKLVKQTEDGFEYDEDGIDIMCGTHNIYAEGYGQKINALIAFAKTDPAAFLAEAKTSEQKMLIDIKHALALKVITMEGAVITYADDTLIKKLSNAQNTEEKKANALAAFFSKVENREAYELFQQKIAEAKELSLA